MIYYVIAVLLIIFVLMFTILYYKKQNADLNEKLKIKDQVMKGLTEELFKLREEMRIREEAKNDTEKKIDDLHNGDAVANAIGKLSKHKDN